MKLPNPTGLIRVGRTFIVANRPEILFGASITATLGAVVLAAKGGWDARGIVDGAKNDTVALVNANSTVPTMTFDDVNITKREMANLTWHCYMPAALATLTAVGSTTGLHYVHVKDKKAMATMALAAIEQVKEDAKAFEKDNLGILTDEEKSNVLEGREKDGVAEVVGTDGEVEEFYLVRDHITGRDIWSNQHRIEDALIEVGNVINGSGTCELGHFYNHAGYSAVPLGLEMGWDHVLPSIQWTTTVRDDGRPVREFTFRPPPAKGFDTGV